MQIEASIRNKAGTVTSRYLRNTGITPAMVYGCKNKPPLSISIPSKEINRLHEKGFLLNSKIYLKVNDDILPVLVHDFQLHPIHDELIHVDFKILDKEYHDVVIPVRFFNLEESSAIKTGGFLNKVKRSVLLRCPTSDIPKFVSLDLSDNKSIKKVFRASDIQIAENNHSCILLEKQDAVIASIIGKFSSSNK